MSVYGNLDPRARIRWVGSYGKEKLRCERDARRAGRRLGKEVYVLRLGHVCGELQNLTALIRDQIARGPILMPGGGDRPSNTVYTATVVEAACHIGAGRERPGTYDLLSNPQWTWRQVYDYEASRCGLRLQLEASTDTTPGQPSRGGIWSWASRTARRWLSQLRASPVVREAGRRVLSSLPATLNEKIEARYRIQRARAEVAPLLERPPSHEAFLWIPVGTRFLTSLSPTIELLKDPLYQILPPEPGRSFPEDLPPFVP